MSRRPTISDVAEASGFSRTTVSHALSGKRALNVETVRKIRDVAEQLGYAPSRSARALRLGRSGTIGLLSPAVGERRPDDEVLGLAFFMRLSAEVARRAFLHGQMVLLMPHSREMAKLSDAELDGALLSDPESGDPVVAVLRELEVPLVTLESDPDDPGDPWQVHADHAKSTRDLLDHFAGQGSERPALMIPDISWAWTAQVREAYERWCREARREPIVEVVRASGSEHAATRLLARSDRPDAIYALTEAYGPAVLGAAGRLGLEVPNDVMVACGVDSSQALSAEVPLTAIALAPERQARAAVDLLLERIDGRTAGPVVIEAELVIRDSSIRRGNADATSRSRSRIRQR